MRHYLWIVGPTQDEDAAWCDRAEAWLREHEGDERQIDVRLPHRGEVCGLFEYAANGNLHTTSYDHASGDEDIETVEELLGGASIAAWESGDSAEVRP